MNLKLGIKSTSGYIYTKNQIVVSWTFRIQKFFALSSTNTEYVVITEDGKEIIWMTDFLEEL